MLWWAEPTLRNEYGISVYLSIATLYRSGLEALQKFAKLLPANNLRVRAAAAQNDDFARRRA